MSSFFIILNQLIQFFLLLMLGYLLAGLHKIKREELGILSKLVVNLLLPAYSFAAMYRGATREQLMDGIILFPMGMAVFTLLAVFLFFLAKGLHIEEGNAKVFQASFLFGNTGFIGTPLLKNLYGGEGVIYLSLFSISEAIILWTYGIRLLHGDSKEKFHFKNLLNPNIIVVLTGIFLILTDITLPDILINTVKTIGGANVPVCMIYLGAVLYFSDFTSVLRRKELYLGVVLKMLLFPLLMAALIRGLPVLDSVKGTVVLICGLPTMIVVPMLAAFGKSDGSYAMGMAMGTLVLSLITLPIVTYLVL